MNLKTKKERREQLFAQQKLSNGRVLSLDAPQRLMPQSQSLIPINAFSVAEAMIALLIGTIVLGFSAPMITKQLKHNDFTSIQAQIMNKKIENVKNISDANAGKISDILDGKNVADYVDYIKSLENNIKSLEDRLSDVETVTNNTNIQNIISGTNQQKNYDSDISSINKNLSDLTTSIDNIDNDLTKLEKDIKNLVPKDTVAFFNLSDCPSGWSAINANWRGRFPRFAGSYTVLAYDTANKTYKTTGTAQTLSVGATQEDAIRNITGRSGDFEGEETTVGNNGAISTLLSSDGWEGGHWATRHRLEFDASLVVPISVENRPKAVALLGCVKN